MPWYREPILIQRAYEVLINHIVLPDLDHVIHSGQLTREIGRCMDKQDPYAQTFDGYEDVPSSSFSLRHFSLMNSLFTVINRARADSLESVLARYFLQHFEHLERLNVYDVAGECYTSRSGMRRFCQSIGFDNFSDIKDSNYEWSHHWDYFSDYALHADYRNHLASSMAGMCEEINRMVDQDRFDRLADIMHGASEVVLVASDFSSMAVHDFQQCMLYAHKLVDILTDSQGDEARLSTMDEQGLVVVISATGNFARAVANDLSTCRGRKVLVTLNPNAESVSHYDDVFLLKEIEPGQSYRRRRTVFTKYGVNYFFDLLYNRYLTLFCDDGGDAEEDAR